MCDFCYMEKGDSPKKPVIEKTISLGVYGERYISGYIYTDYEKPTLIIDFEVGEIKTHIKYCPMCGRKLDGMDSKKNQV